MADDLHNRHVRFVTNEGGIWGEPIRVMSGLRRDAGAAVLVPQFQGTATSAVSTWPTSIQPFVDALPIWSDYTLDQLSASYYTISKRTNAGRKASFLNHAGFGKRASGLGYIGGAQNGGVVFSFRGQLAPWIPSWLIIPIHCQIFGRELPGDRIYVEQVLTQVL